MIDKLVSFLVVLSYVVYLSILLLSQFLLSGPGLRVPIYAFLGVVGAIPVLADNRRLRLWSLPAVLLALALVTYDHSAGMKFQERIWKIRLNAEKQRDGDKVQER